VKPGIVADVHARGGTLAGSVITLDAGKRFEAAGALVKARALIHADVFGVGYTLMEGASRELLAEIARVWPEHVDVHVMAEDAEFVIAGFGLSRRVRRVSVHAEPRVDLARVRSAIALVADEFWISVDSAEWTASDLAQFLEREQPSGVLEMLAPAGIPGHQANLMKLSEPSWAVARTYGPIGVDGGVRSSHLDGLVDAGVSYFVMGRSLLA
jgi:pentose-5-phosphate-3-epimerase